MPVLKVLKYPDERLYLKAEEVQIFDENLRSKVKDMFETMYQEKGAGLAATQVNIQKQIFVMDTSVDQDEPKCLINPKIIDKQDQVLSDEGCLSFPGIYVKVKRAAQVTCQYQDEFGTNHVLTATELESICIQHEMDHLNGVVFVDRLSKLKRNLMMKKLKYLKKASTA